MLIINIIFLRLLKFYFIFATVCCFLLFLSWYQRYLDSCFDYLLQIAVFLLLSTQIPET